jgi:hypothetical protein
VSHLVVILLAFLASVYWYDHLLHAFFVRLGVIARFILCCVLGNGMECSSSRNVVGCCVDPVDYLLRMK